MMIRDLMRTLKRSGEAIGQMKKILAAEEDKGPCAKVAIEAGILRDWYQAFLGLSMLLGSMEIEEIKTDRGNRNI